MATFLVPSDVTSFTTGVTLGVGGRSLSARILEAGGGPAPS
jgi:hypothetical protein